MTCIWMCMLAVASFVAGLWIFRDGFVIWDDTPLHLHSQWLLSNYGIGNAPSGLSDNGKWTAPLWPMVLGLATEVVFPWLRDPFVIRHALTFALLPVSLAACYLLLRNAGFARSTSVLAVALLTGDIRLMGASTVALRDFPAAMGWLLCALGLWIVVRRWQAAGGGTKQVGAGLLVAAAAISVCPFLLRSPVILPFALLITLVVLTALPASRLSIGKRIAVVAVPVLAGIACIAALSPMLWKLPQDWAHPFELFSSFPFGGAVRVFGKTFRSTALPIWYPFAWFPMRYHPFALAVILFGSIAAFLSPPDRDAVMVSLYRWKLKLSLLHWLTVLLFAIWVVFVALRPDVYDEDRHLHFLFVLIPVIAAIGAEHLLRERIRWILATVAALLSVLTVILWGHHSYIYKSPLIGNRNPHLFLGDYRAVCMVDAFNALHVVVPGGAKVVLEGPNYEAASHIKRLKESRLAPHPEWAEGYTIHRDRTTLEEYVLITYDSLSVAARLRKDVAEGRARIVWQSTMPPGVPNCLMAVYDNGVMQRQAE